MWKWLRRLFGLDNDPDKEDVSGAFAATLTPTDQRLTVDQFVDLSPTPGNVAVCLCGGGSRALTAGTGQLRALKHLTTADGSSLISQAKVISTVSGGSWLGVTYVYLTPDTSDDDFLNRYVADPGRLVPSKTDGHDLSETLDELPEGNIGQRVGSRLFEAIPLTLLELLLHKFGGVPFPFVWQTTVSLLILKPYGLFDPGEDFEPTSFFSYDEKSLAAILRANPQLDREQAHLVASGTDRERRPFLVCNTSMFLTQPGQSFEPLAPVEATSFMTGIVGEPRGRDANGNPVGGGGVTSLAFSSNPTAVSGNDVTITQQRQLALMDIVGASSAFYASAIENLLDEWDKDRDEFFRKLDEAHDELIECIDEILPGHFLEKVLGFIDRELLDRMKDDDDERHGFLEKLLSEIDKLRAVIPEYQYWPVKDAAPAAQTRPTRFADGGNLENTGVANALSHDDVDGALALVNSSTPMVAAAKGVIDADGNEVPGTRVEIDSQIPPLFGYQGYDAEKGYVLYEGDEDPSGPDFEHNKIFPSEAFPELIKGFWAAAGNTGDPADLGVTGKDGIPGVDENPVIFKQELELQDNTWFRVRGGRKVTVVWYYLNRVKSWYDQLTPDVQEILGPFDDPKSFHDFPHYVTFDLHIPATQFNLLTQLTAWCLGNSPEVKELFAPQDTQA